MNVPLSRKSVSVEDYLALETERKYEYFGGHIYLRPDERNLHNAIAGNILANLHHRLCERPCRPHTSGCGFVCSCQATQGFIIPMYMSSAAPMAHRNTFRTIR